MIENQTMDWIGYRIYDDWIRLKRNGKSIEYFFVQNNYKNIAIYGMGMMGVQLYEELRETNVDIKFAIDKNASNICVEGLDIYSLDNLPEQYKNLDAVIVTPIPYFYEIERTLMQISKEIDIIPAGCVIWYSR